MKNNNAVPLITQAIQKLGYDFSLARAKALLNAAINEINHVEKKRDKRKKEQDAIEKQDKEKRAAQLKKWKEGWEKEQEIKKVEGEKSNSDDML